MPRGRWEARPYLYMTWEGEESGEKESELYPKERKEEHQKSRVVIDSCKTGKSRVIPQKKLAAQGLQSQGSPVWGREPRSPTGKVNQDASLRRQVA